MSSITDHYFLNTDDTICAISTPSGVGGIAVCRVSGKDAISIVSQIWRGANLDDAQSHTAHLGTVLDDAGQDLDQAVATVFRAPSSFTTQDTVEISIHGSSYIQQAIISSLIKAGARLANPGEFTRRAFVAGRFDLAQAEAIADLISSTSRAAQQLALKQMKGSVSRRLNSLREQLVELASLVELELDFSEEEVEFASRSHLHELAEQIHNEVNALRKTFATGQAIKNGIPTAIVGPTNAGKSSLLNALTGDERAIVSDIHGTTRDTIEDTIPLPSGHTLRLIDTAGLRSTNDTIERLGIDRTLCAVRQASIIIAVVPANTPEAVAPLLAEIRKEAPDAPIILALNKIDLLNNEGIYKTLEILNDDVPFIVHSHAKSDIYEHLDLSGDSSELYIIGISAKNGEGLDLLRENLRLHAHMLTASGDTDGIIITNARHAETLGKAAESLAFVLNDLNIGLSGDLLAQDIRQAIHHLSTLTGDISTDTLLHSIFSRFCIGK